MKKKFLTFLLILVFVSFFTSNIYATDSSTSAQINIKYQAINPSDDYRYAFKRLQEKIFLLILSYSPAKKAEYFSYLLEVRLAELKFVVDKEDISNIETSSQRFSGTAGTLTDFIKQNYLTSQKQSVKEKMQQQIATLEVIRDKYPANSAGWLFIQHDINYLKIYLSQLSQ